MYSLPKTIVLNDVTYHIRADGDYRMVLDCFNAINDYELTEQERIIAVLLIFVDEFNDLEDVAKVGKDVLDPLITEIFKFFNCGQDDCPANHQHFKVLDWGKDAQMICSAVNSVANTEVRALPYLHWWTFMGYFNAVGESQLATVVSIRTKLAKHEKMEKYEKKFVQDNPQYFNLDSRTTKQKEDDELIKQLWSSGGAC